MAKYQWIWLLRANWQWSDANFIIEGGVTLGHWRRFISDFAFTIGLQSDDFWNYIKEYDITIGQEQWFSYDEATGSATMTLTSRSGFEASSSSECATVGPASMSSRTQSGSSGAMGTIARGMSRRSGSHVVNQVFPCALPPPLKRALKEKKARSR